MKMPGIQDIGIYVLLVAITESASYFSKESDCPILPNISHAKIRTYSLGSLEASVECDEGYKLVGAAKLLCRGGQWQPKTMPQCIRIQPTGVCSDSNFVHSTVRMDVSKKSAEVECNPGYSIKLQGQSLKSLKIICNDDLKWVSAKGGSIFPECSRNLECPPPPEVSHATVSHISRWPSYTDDTSVSYKCDSGYQSLARGTYDDYLFHSEAILHCSEGKWIGETPVCVKIPGCSKPPDVKNGQWSIMPMSLDDLAMSEPQSTYHVGTRIKYFCIGSKMIGADEMECLTNGLWSHLPPQCLDMGNTVSCSEPPPIPNGMCRCDPQLCRQYGSTMECLCNDNFRLSGEEELRCIIDSNAHMTWNANFPTCIPIDQSIQTVDRDADSGSGHMNTLAIVIATACSVLGVLLLVMVVMVFRRRKPQSRLYPQVGGAPPPYSRVYNNTTDEHDRVALIGYEAARLPSYEEATRSRSLGPGRLVREPVDERMFSSTDYRPLPNIPTNLRSAGPADTISNRHSISTMSTVNRDGTSEVFGSIDTVNVSISDASTSVTVDTLDSAASRPSIASGRATAGSLETSRENLSTEDVPLLDERMDEESGNDDLDIQIEDENKET